MITITLPYSKSISNRLLIMHHLSQNKIALNHLSQSEDTTLLQNILQNLKKETTTPFHTHNAGTTTRFLIALLSIIEGEWKIEADQRMNHRPILPLIEALKQLGADIEINSETKISPLQSKGKNYKAIKQ